MQKSTLMKIEEIKTMLSEGATEKDIIKAKFRNSPKAFGEWREKFGEYLGEVATVETETKVSLFNPRDFGKLKTLLDNAEGLLALLERRPEKKIQEINLLSIPEDIKKLKDIEIKSFRVSKSLVSEFDQLAEQHKELTKTALINLALKEFIDRYK